MSYDGAINEWAVLTQLLSDVHWHRQLARSAFVLASCNSGCHQCLPLFHRFKQEEGAVLLSLLQQIYESFCVVLRAFVTCQKGDVMIHLDLD